MTLEEIENDLPEGLHDALILSLHHDYEQATVRMKVSVCTETDEIRREGIIEFSGVLYCAVELPISESSFKHTGGLWITSFDKDSESIPRDLVREIPEGILRYSIFNRDWCSEIHIAARSVDWQEIESSSGK